MPGQQWPQGRKESDPGKPPSTSHSSTSFGQSSSVAGSSSAAVPTLISNSGNQSPQLIFQHIHETASKRISTLDYLRKAQEGHLYYFNTLLLTRSHLSSHPSHAPRPLARRATHYLLLGLSLPPITDLPASSPLEHLRALHALLSEFESYQNIHPADGTSSSLSRARLPQMFKRAAHSSSTAKSLGMGSVGRRTSSATEIGLPIPTSSTSGSTNDTTISNPTTHSSSSLLSSPPPSSTPPPTAFPASEQELLPGEEYLHLLTPSLPFEPDYYEVFATLCDVLIDAYQKILALANSPTACAAGGVGELFTKCDAKVRKLVVGGVVKELEEVGRGGVRAEVGGVGKVVLSGLM
ncbi:MAG: hypothetical protein M1824_005313 [Vezdaea acicularis]|nr:MAG: hypothetical protein M1824_005313 [Vezdaea acicularis]